MSEKMPDPLRRKVLQGAVAALAGGSMPGIAGGADPKITNPFHEAEPREKGKNLDTPKDPAMHISKMVQEALAKGDPECVELAKVMVSMFSTMAAFEEGHLGKLRKELERLQSNNRNSSLTNIEAKSLVAGAIQFITHKRYSYEAAVRALAKSRPSLLEESKPKPAPKPRVTPEKVKKITA